MLRQKALDLESAALQQVDQDINVIGDLAARMQRGYFKGKIL